MLDGVPQCRRRDGRRDYGRADAASAVATECTAPSARGLASRRKQGPEDDDETSKGNDPGRRR